MENKLFMEEPLNSNERFLYAIAVRLEVLIDQMSGISELLAKLNDTPIESNVTSEQVTTVKEELAEEKPKKVTRKKKVE